MLLKKLFYGNKLTFIPLILINFHFILYIFRHLPTKCRPTLGALYKINQLGKQSGKVTFRHHDSQHNDIQHNAMTLGKMTLGKMTLGKMTLSKMTLVKMTFS